MWRRVLSATRLGVCHGSASRAQRTTESLRAELRSPFAGFVGFFRVIEYAPGALFRLRIGPSLFAIRHPLFRPAISGSLSASIGCYRQNKRNSYEPQPRRRPLSPAPRSYSFAASSFFIGGGRLETRCPSIRNRTRL